MRINKHDTNGTKPLLGKGELGYDDYTAGGDTGRVYVGTSSENIALAERLEANMMTKAQFNALAEERKANRAGSGFDSFGKHNVTIATNTPVNEGMWTVPTLANSFILGSESSNVGVSVTQVPNICINGTKHTINKVNSNAPFSPNVLQLPTAPNIYPYDTVLTAEQIASGVIKHADASNSGLIVNGKFDTDTSGWTANNATLSVENNKLKIVDGGEYSAAKQSFTTVIGKRYILEFDVTNNTDERYLCGVHSSSTWNGASSTNILYVEEITSTTGSKRKSYEFVATSTTSMLMVGATGTFTCYFDNITVYPADAISRSDLVFLESWHEDISEKNFVYPLGNTQYLGANTDGLTGIVNGSFTGFETYSLFGNWQTPSSLIGKGYVWSNLTEAQKKAFIANPENNCYLDGDKTIQVRYRVRVVMGLGDSWDYPVAIIDGGGSAPVGSTIAYSVAGNKYLKPKGKKVNILNDVTAYNANDTGFFANKNYQTITTSYESGMATAIATPAATLDTGVAYEGKCFALPIALVHRRNQGAYHPVYNSNGTSSRWYSDGSTLPWYSTLLPPIVSISDCFNFASPSSVQIGKVPSGIYGAFISSVPNCVKRNDGLFYDQVHESDITDLRNNSKKVEDYSRLREKEFNKLVDGTTRGKEGETQIIAIRTFTKSSTFGINGNRFYFGITGTSYPEIALTPEYNLEFTLVGSNGSVYNTRQVLNNPNVGYMYIPLAGNTQVYIPIDGKNTAGTMDTLFPDGTTITVIVAKRTTRIKSNTLLHCDIIGNPSNYPTYWKESGVFGTPLVATEDGASLLPDGARDTFKLSRPVKTGTSILLALRSTDNGATWASFTPTFTTLTNEITLTNEPANNLVMIYYQTKTSMADIVANSEVLEIGEVFSANNGESQHGQYLCSTLLRKVPVWYGKSQGYPLENYELFGKVFWDNSARAPIHKALTYNQFGTSNPAVKILPYLTRINGKAYLNLVYKELKHNGTTWGDDSKLLVPNYVSTTTNNNAQTVLIGQKTVELPYFIAGDE